jgi:hypothetical protein
MSTTQPTAKPPRSAADRAAERLDAWARQHPQAAALARLASLAVRVDASLLRRLRLQLLPRAEPGIEADLWFAGLHAAQGGGSLVFDAAVLQLLRTQLCQASAAPGQPRPLQAAWDITRGLHAAWPEALRIEEEITFLALQGGAGAPAAMGQALQPALAAMASGGDARALEVARWAQRAMPRLPDAARQHPAVLALWLGALVRLGATSGPLPATGPAGLPPDLRWLLPADTGTAPLRVACQPLADGLRLWPLADGAADAAQQITLPAALAPLLAVVSHDGPDHAQHRTVLLQGDTTVPLPPGWQQATLHNLAGQRWQLQRQAGGTTNALPPLAWQQVRVQVLGPKGPVGLGCFVSPTEVVTVVDVLPRTLVDAMRGPDDRRTWAGSGTALPFGQPLPEQENAANQPVRLMLQVHGGVQREQMAQLAALDLYSSLALLTLQRPFAGAAVAPLQLIRPAPGAPVWTVPGLGGQTGQWAGQVQPDARLDRLPEGRLPPDTLAQPFAMKLPQPHGALAGMAGAPMFEGHQLVGLADLSRADPDGSTVWAVPAAAIHRFLAWARRSEAEAPRVLLHHPVDDPYGKGAEMDERAAQRLARAAWRARLHLMPGADGAYTLRSAREQGADGVDDPALMPSLDAAIRLVTPVTRDGADEPGRTRLLALAARRWANPGFPLLNFGFRMRSERQPLPVPLRGSLLQPIETPGPEELARQLLDAADPVPDGGAGPDDGRAVLKEMLETAARPFLPRTSALDAVWQAAVAHDLPAAVDLVTRAWRSSSRLPAAVAADLLAQAALPLPDNSFVPTLRGAAPGAWAVNAMPLQLGRLLVARAHIGRPAPACVLVRDQVWAGEASAQAVEQHLHTTLAAALDCRPDEAALLADRLALPVWMLVATRPLPDASTLQALRSALPNARFLFLAGPQPDFDAAANAAGITPLPAIADRADLAWMHGYKRLMDWAQPRQRASAPAGPKRKTRAK